MSVFETAADRRAERKYKERNTEVTPWSKDAALPNPDNAALLYYQAFLLRPEPNMATSLKIDQILKGAEPDRQIRIYLGHCLPMIRVAELASQIPQCAWGLWYEAEAEFGINSLGVQTRHLTFILAVDSRTLAADGHCRAALARCLTIRRLARHIGDETIIAYLVSRQTDAMALVTLQHVLGVMPPGTDTLAWLQGQLAVVRGAPPAIGKALQADFEGVLHNLRTNPNYLRKLRTVLVEKAEDAQTAKEARNLTDEELLSRARRPYRRFLDSVFRVMASDMPCEWKHARIEELTDELEEEYGDDPAAASVISVCAGRLPEWYELQVRHQAHLSGIKAAVEIYLVVAEAGRLPAKLPEHLPKDPFTGRDFGYEIMDEGFALRCQGEAFQKGRMRRVLEFRVRK
ncbi:MAG: hypothetical protein ACYS74_08295 [Planctomycetota bacterium]|jgi:hypothetical protein